MFAESFLQMNTCLINIIEKTIVVTFNQIVGKGEIVIYNPKENGEPLAIKKITNTNFESITLKKNKGKYRLEINIDNHQIIKFININ